MVKLRNNSECCNRKLYLEGKPTFNLFMRLQREHELSIKPCHQKLLIVKSLSKLRSYNILPMQRTVKTLTINICLNNTYFFPFSIYLLKIFIFYNVQNVSNLMWGLKLWSICIKFNFYNYK